jgi:hypothetical protein
MMSALKKPAVVVRSPLSFEQLLVLILTSLAAIGALYFI